MYDFRLLDSVAQTVLFALLCLCNDVTFRSKFNTEPALQRFGATINLRARHTNHQSLSPVNAVVVLLFLVSNVILIIVKEQ